MKSQQIISTEMAQVIVKISFRIIEFSKIIDQNDSETSRNIYECSENIKKGLNWFIESENSEEMHENIEAYLNSINKSISVFNELNLALKQKNKLNENISHLKGHLIELQKQLKLNH